MSLTSTYTQGVIRTTRIALAALAWLLTLPAVYAAGEDASEALLQSAVKQYDDAMELSDRTKQLPAFRQAMQLFKQVLEGNHSAAKQSSPELWIAFANASLRSEQIGWAILGYRQALSLDPSNAQARQNLDFARTLVAWQSTGAENELGDTLFFWRKSYSRSGQQFFAAILFLAAGITAALSVAFSKRWVIWFSVLLFAVWCVFCIPIALDTFTDSESWAVVVVDEAVLRTADAAGAPERLSAPLPSGAELKVLSRRDSWVEVAISSGSGWLRSHEIRTADAPFEENAPDIAP